MCTRCALHGLIYLWDLKSTTKSLTEDTKKDKIIEKEVREQIRKMEMFIFLKSGDYVVQPEVE